MRPGRRGRQACATEVIASLDASWPGADWARRFDYNLDRMMVHGLRRAAEMEEVVKTLDALGTGSAMTRGTVERQRAMGVAAACAPPEGLRPSCTDFLLHPAPRRTESRRVIIDCHGHYTTAPAAHNDWREAQKAAFKAGEIALRPTPGSPTTRSARRWRRTSCACCASAART